MDLLEKNPPQLCTVFSFEGLKQCYLHPAFGGLFYLRQKVVVHLHGFINGEVADASIPGSRGKGEVCKFSSFGERRLFESQGLAFVQRKNGALSE